VSRRSVHIGRRSRFTAIALVGTGPGTIAVAITMEIALALGFLGVVTASAFAAVIAVVALTSIIMAVVTAVRTAALDDPIKALSSHSRQSTAGGQAVKAACRLLPAEVGQEYLEEWHGWLYDQRLAGDPWYRRLGTVISILLNVPHLALTLNATRRRAVK